jgi:hypothetical protein
MTTAALWLPIRRGQQEWLVHLGRALAGQPLPEGRARIVFGRRHRDCDESWYTLKLMLASRLEAGAE